MCHPLLSVIIPVYGVEKYISQCLESVINQTYKNIEVIVINDGTKDNSAAIAKEYVKRDNRVKIYDFENGGLSVARNRGLDLANGELIAFLDSDDWIAPNMYEILVNRLIASNSDMVKCGFCETDGKGLSNVTFESDFETSGFTNYFQGVLWTVVWNAVYKKELALKVHFPPNVVNEDNYASGMYIKLSNKIAVISNIFYYYRINPSGISKNSGGVKRPLDKCIAIDLLRMDLQKEGYIDKKLDWKLACEIYHFVRGWNTFYKVIAIQNGIYDFVLKNLDVRRKITFYYLVKKKNIIFY